MSEPIITSRTTLTSVSGTFLVSESPDGVVMELPAMRPMTENEIQGAAESDPDAQPRTAVQLRNVRRVPHVKTMRRALGLTQEQFASRYQIPLGTLRDWEQGCSEPDQTARAYLKAIAGAPEVISRVLQQTTTERARV